MRDLDELFVALEKSKFRSSFKLKGKEAKYLKERTIPVLLEHARDFITKRLAAANPPNNGRQTPMKNHPVFIAQHATATCCRNCLKKWHNIHKGKPLSQDEIDYIVSVIGYWLKNQN
ncbi:MAG: DUF4186 domain-containing protein [Planctomycetota bacterium]|jgi:hypothetical protein